MNFFTTLALPAAALWPQTPNVLKPRELKVRVSNQTKSSITTVRATSLEQCVLEMAKTPSAGCYKQQRTTKEGNNCCVKISLSERSGGQKVLLKFCAKDGRGAHKLSNNQRPLCSLPAFYPPERHNFSVGEVTHTRKS
jgi:hypothetical protein